ncbi:hypothetical protein ABT173_03905 [Streptomyces sp. NPDC001795]|uniref:hypothetical protein n=1 Tax=unclassified Streptomyces TaxID=2593676 RepID=UPI003320192D
MNTAGLVTAGALAVALNIVPSTAAVADSIRGSDDGTAAVVLSGLGMPHHDNHYVRSVSGDTTATAVCDPGDVATGGGYQTTTSFGVSENRPTAVPGPFGTANAWVATLELGQTGPITAYVLCE